MVGLRAGLCLCDLMIVLFQLLNQLLISRKPLRKCSNLRLIQFGIS